MNRRRWGGVLLGASSFALYLRTLAPSVAALFDDSLEFQLAGYRLAIAHPTGYPFYLLLLKGFTLLPFGEIAGRANLVSAVCAALAVMLVYAVVLTLTGSILSGITAGAALAVSSVFWSQAVVAEVYALNAVFVAAVTWWVAKDSVGAVNASASSSSTASFDPVVAGRFGKLRMLAPFKVKDRGKDAQRPSATILAFLFGLALTHHRTIVLIAPAVAVYLLLDRRGAWRRQISRLINARTLLAIGAPLLLYLYLPLRGNVGSLDGTYQNAAQGFWNWITASYYNIFLTGNPFNEKYDAAFFFTLFQQQFGWVGLALCLAGAAELCAHDMRGFFAYWLIAFVTVVVFVVNYRVPDVQVFAIPAFVLMAIALGTAIHGAGQRLAQLGARAGVGQPHTRTILAATTPAVLLALGLLPSLSTAWAANDLSGQTAVRDMGRDWLAEPFPPDARLVGILGEMTLVRYLQAAEGRAPSLITVAADRDAERMAAIDNGIAAGAPVFTTRPLNGLPQKYALGAAGGLVRVWPSPLPPELPDGAPQIAGIRYRFDGATQPYPGVLRAQITWQPSARISADLKVSARLMDGTRLVAQHDDWPVYNTYHTPFWRAGETIRDAYRIDISHEVAAREYQVLLIVYQADSGAEAGRIDGGRITLK